jgi:hypothetical protein
MSSIASRAIDIIITTASGITAVLAASGEIAGIDCSVATTRK